MSSQSRPKRACLRLAALLCLGLTAAPTPLAAQSSPDQSSPDQSSPNQGSPNQGAVAQDGAKQETQRFEDWTLRCRPASETQPRTCRMHQNLVDKESGQPLVQFMVGRFGPEKVLGVVIVVPIGVRLPPGLGLQVDEQPLRVYPFESCDPKSCQARAILDNELLKDLKAGLNGQVRFQSGAGQVLVATVSLKGFSAALRALP